MNQMRKMLTILMATAFAGMSSFADWSWSGKTGSVTIPSGTTATVADGDVATVAALTGIEIESGATLSFANTGTALTLATDLSGGGAITGTGSKGVTFSGDNSGFTGPMTFNDSFVYVTSRRGLGSSSMVTHNVSSATAGTLRFRGAGLTNDAPITVSGWRNNAVSYFTDSFSDPLVFNGAFVSTGSGMNYGDYTFNGTFTSGSGAGSMTFKGATVFNGKVNLRGGAGSRTFWIDAGKTATLMSAGNQWDDSTLFSSAGTLVCGADNVLDSERCMKTCYNNASATDHSGTLNLNGHGQRLTYICNGFTTTSSSKPFYTVTSASLATLTMSANGSYGAAIKFSGKASHRHTGRGTYTMWNQKSDTSGTLYVDQGGVAFEGGAGWYGDIEVSSTGRVYFTSGSTLHPDGKSRITLNDTGKIFIAEGVELRCTALTLPGGAVSDDTYSSATLPEAIEGGGSLKVEDVYVIEWTGGGSGGWSDPDNWDGVSLSAGDEVVIPVGKNAPVYDADVAMLASLGKITVNGTLTFANASSVCTVNARLSGVGTVTAPSASAGVVLAADNSEHAGPMSFVETPVTVTARYGLGSSTRTVSHVNASSTPARLKFEGAGLTNDVPLSLTGSRKDSVSFYTLLADFRDPLVQNGSVSFAKGNGSLSICLGDWSFNGDVSVVAPVVFYVKGIAWFNGAYWMQRQNGYSFNVSRDCELHMSQYSGTWPAQTITDEGKYVCEADNVISRDREVIFGAFDDSGQKTGTLDINGHDQLTSYLTLGAHASAGRSASSPGMFCVTSATPATLRLTLETGDATKWWSPVRITGQANLTVNGTTPGAYTFKFAPSTTSGLLAVSNGYEVAFVTNSGWYGDMLVSGSGSMVTLDDTSSLEPNGTAAITLADNGSLGIGGLKKCAKFVVGGQEMRAGFYGAADCANPRVPAENRLSCIVGTGVLKVGKTGFGIIFR